jgi:PTH1 family peptidyl-tRNA hydrolase
VFAIVGLGNPGSTYSKNRHNIGYMIADIMADAFDAKFARSKFEGLATTIIHGKNFDIKDDFVMLKSTAFMNNSGNSVQKLMQFYKLKSENIIVIHDDLDLELADIRVKLGGSDAGHNGLRSITANIGSGYNRVRIGIGRPKIENSHNKGSAILNYVLGDFSNRELEILESENVFQKASNEALSIINGL